MKLIEFVNTIFTDNDLGYWLDDYIAGESEVVGNIYKNKDKKKIAAG